MLQKIKKIGIIALVAFILTGATYFLFNLYSKIFLQRYLGRLLNDKCKITGYHFSIFGSLNFKELKLDDGLFVKNFTLTYNPLSLLILKKINYIHAEELVIYPKKLKKSGDEYHTTFPSTFSLPIQFGEIKINNAIVVLDTNKIELNSIYLVGEGTGKPFRIRSYVNDISFNDENLYLYSDIIVEKNRILIKDFEIQNNIISVSSTSGIIYLPDSLRLKIDHLKLHQNSAKDINLLYLMAPGRLFLDVQEIVVKGRNLREVYAEIKQELPESLLIEKICFKYRGNVINGNGFYLIKKRKLSIRNLDISLNEAGLNGKISSSLEFEKGRLSGEFSSRNLKYMDSEDFQVSCNFVFHDNKLQINMDNVTSENSRLSGKIFFADSVIKIIANGVLSLSDISKEQNGIISINVNYLLGKEYRNGHASFTAKALSYKKIVLSEAFLTLSSKGQEDTIQIHGKELITSKIHVDSIATLLVSKNLKNATMFLSAFQKSSSLKGDFSLTYLGNKNFNFRVMNLQLLMGDADTFEIIDPLNIVKRNEKVTIDTGKILVNSHPLLVKGNLDLSTKEINAQFLMQKLKINNLAGISSILSGSLYLKGNLTNPTVEAWIQAEKFNYKDYKDLKLCASARISESGLLLDTASIYGPSIDVDLNGFFPLTFSLQPFEFKPKHHEQYNIVARIRDLPVEKINKLTGKQLLLNSMKASGDIQIYGTYNSEPLLSGFLKAENISGIYMPIHLEFSNGEILAELEGDGFKITKGVASVDHGTIIIKGHGKKLFKRDREIFLAFTGTNVTLYPSNDLFASCDAKIDVFIEKDGVTVKGDAIVKEATIFRSIRPTGESHSQPPQNLNLVLNLKLEGNTFWVNEVADIEIKGDLVYQITEGRTFLDGTADIVKGYFLYLDRIFEIQSGYVNFSSSVNLEPELNLKAVSKVDTFTVYLELTGTMRNPQITLTSEPPLDESSIIYLLTLGKLYSDTALSGIEELAELKNRAFTLASTLVSQNLRRTLRFQELRLTGTENPALLVGLYLNPHLYLWYSHDIFDITKDMFRIRYKVNNNFGIFAERDQERRLLIGLDYTYEF